LIGCGGQAAKYRDAQLQKEAKYRDAQLQIGMTIYEVKKNFGEPDSYEQCWSKYDSTGSTGSSTEDPKYPFHIEELEYGAFGAHSQRSGHVTKYRLTMSLVDGQLREWSKSAPIGES
jgi:hypothetical protein